MNGDQDGTTADHAYLAANRNTEEIKNIERFLEHLALFYKMPSYKAWKAKQGLG